MKKIALRLIALAVVALMMIGASLIFSSYISHDVEDRADNSGNDEDSVIFSAGPGIWCVNTSTLTIRKGYGGRTPLIITINDNDVITGIEAKRNAETPDFFRRAESLYSAWIGKSVNEAAEIEPDAVTGATLSSEAIKENMKVGLYYYMHNEKPEITGGSTMPEGVRFWIALAVTVCAAVLPLFVRNRIYRIIQLTANVGVLGFWAGEFLSYSRISGLLSDPAGIIATVIPFIMLIVAFLYPVFGRRQHYCNNMCPLGSLQILAGMCCNKSIPMSIKVVKGLTYFRIVLWIILTFFLWLPFALDWMNYELFSAFLVRSASLTVLICAGIFILLSFFIPRPYCNFVCPTGSLMKVEERLFDNSPYARFTRTLILLALAMAVAWLSFRLTR